MIKWFRRTFQKVPNYIDQSNTVQSPPPMCCAFSGHRPEKLSRTPASIKHDLQKEIKIAVDEGYSVFISGMARGVDIWGAEAVLQLRDEGYPIQLICAIPFPGFERSWSMEWRKQYSFIISEADNIFNISPAYNHNCFQIRNEWMVNHSNMVLAVFNGQPSGTKNTIDYATEKGIPVRIVRG